MDATSNVLFPGPAGVPVAFGTWALGGSDWGPVTTGKAKEVLRCAWDLGFRHFDTAESYGSGRSEQLVGQAFRREIRSRRDTIRIATKTVVRDAPAVTRHLERSLRRLGTDYIDLFYIHWPREGVDLLRAVEELHRQKERGLLGALGLCNITAREYETIKTRFPVSAVQIGYNILWRSPGARLWPGVTETKVAYSPLAQGLLARPFPESPRWHGSDHRQKTPLFSTPAWEHVQRFNTLYIAACREKGLDPAAVAVQWLLARDRLDPEAPAVDAVVVGGRTVSHLKRLVTGLSRYGAVPNDNPHRELSHAIEELYRETRPFIPDLPNMFGYVPQPVKKRGWHRP